MVVAWSLLLSLPKRTPVQKVQFGVFAANRTL